MPNVYLRDKWEWTDILTTVLSGTTPIRLMAPAKYRCFLVTNSNTLDYLTYDFSLRHYLNNLISVQPPPHLLSLFLAHQPSPHWKSQIAMHHPVSGIDSLIHSVSLASHVSTHFLIRHLISVIFTTLIIHHVFHSFSLGSKPIFSTNLSHLSIPTYRWMDVNTIILWIVWSGDCKEFLTREPNKVDRVSWIFLQQLFGTLTSCHVVGFC